MTRLLQASFLIAFVAVSAGVARADDRDATANRQKLEEAKGGIASMRDTFAYVQKKEEASKSAHDPVLLNCLHGRVAHISDLISVADHALDDMRVAITSGEAPEAIDAEVEKIALAKTKVDQAWNDADRCVSIKPLTNKEGNGETSRAFAEEGAALTGEGGTSEGGGASTDPLGVLTTSASVPSIFVYVPTWEPLVGCCRDGHPPPASASSY